MSSKFPHERIYGTIYGNCIGDAIGLLTEFMNKKQARQHYPARDLEYDQKVHDSHRSHWQNGDWTDDSDQMILMMLSIMDHNGEVVAKDYGQKIKHWAYNGFPELGDKGGTGLGRTTLNVLLHEQFDENPHLAAEEVWRNSGCSAAPNGAVMRTSMMGIYQFDDLEKVTRNTLEFCKVTHADYRCQASCVAVTTALSLMLQGKHMGKGNYFDVEAIIDKSFVCAKKLIPEGKHQKEYIEDLRFHMYAESIKDLKLDERYKVDYTYKTLGAGFWAFKQNDFRQALQGIVMEAGDADTNGAVAGALLGCKLGETCLPDSWLHGLVNKKWLDKKISRFLSFAFPGSEPPIPTTGEELGISPSPEQTTTTTGEEPATSPRPEQTKPTTGEEPATSPEQTKPTTGEEPAPSPSPEPPIPTTGEELGISPSPEQPTSTTGEKPATSPYTESPIPTTGEIPATSPSPEQTKPTTGEEPASSLSPEQPTTTGVVGLAKPPNPESSKPTKEGLAKTMGLEPTKEDSLSGASNEMSVRVAMAFELPKKSNIKEKERKAAERRNKMNALLQGVPTSDFNEIGEVAQLAAGSFGIVSRCKFHGKECVVKELLEPGMEELKLFAKEARLLHSMDHENIVSFLSACISACGKKSGLILDYISFSMKPLNGADECFSTLRQLLNEMDELECHSFEHLPEAMATDIAQGLSYLHSHDIVHRDLKPRNILVSNQQYSELSPEEIQKFWIQRPVIAKLTDFGESRASLIRTHTLIKSQTSKVGRGTPAYMAPEILSLEHGQSTGLEDMKAMDVWSFSMVLFALLNPDLPMPYHIEIDGSNMQAELLKRLLSEEKLPKSSGKYETVRKQHWTRIDLVYKLCAKFNPLERGKLDKVLEVLKKTTHGASPEARLSTTEGIADKIDYCSPGLSTTRLLLNNLRAFQTIIVDNLRFEDGLVSCLEMHSVIDHDTADEINTIVTRKAQARRLLLAIEQAGTPETFSGFLSALQETDQTHLVHLIKTGDQSQIVSPEDKSKGRKMKYELATLLQKKKEGYIRDLLLKLVEKSHITERQKDYILAQKLAMTQGKELVEVLLCRPHSEIIRDMMTSKENFLKGASELLSTKDTTIQYMVACDDVLYREKSNMSCPYWAVCDRFIDSLGLPGIYFDYKYDKCFCANCMSAHRDLDYYDRGTPSTLYALPKDWIRFGLSVSAKAHGMKAMTDWHVAFHGTVPQNLKTIIESDNLLMPGDYTIEGNLLKPPEGHFTEEKKPFGFDVKQVFVSPTIAYAGLPVYSRQQRWTDPQTWKTHKIQVALQVWIKPGSYAVGKETLGLAHKGIILDPKFDNSELEWSTKIRGAIVLQGILIKCV